MAKLPKQPQRSPGKPAKKPPASSTKHKPAAVKLLAQTRKQAAGSPVRKGAPAKRVRPLPEEVDVLVVGDHPCAYLAGALLGQEPALRVAHVRQSQMAQERLVLINPALFALHKLLAPLQDKLDLQELYGVRFLADDPQTSSELRMASPMLVAARMLEVRDQFPRPGRVSGGHAAGR
jgi:hypothetical protein